MPNLCHLCRAQLRLSFRNERVFYKRPCDKCKRDVVSMYSPNKPFTVWCYDCWFSDDWDAEDYGMDFDFDKPFIEQFKSLWQKVPKVALIYVRSPGSEYTNISADNKNCYMIVESSNNEDSVHSYWIQECRDVIDTSFASKCELCYESDDSYNSYKLLYSKGCHDCRESFFLLDCKDCVNCVGCINLRNKQYCIFNEQLTKEAYEQKLSELKLDTRSGVEAFRKEFLNFIAQQPRKYAEIVNTVNSTGNYIKHAKNCISCFHCYDAEDNKYSVHVWRNAKDCMDTDTAGRNAVMIYNSINSGLDTANQISCAVCWSTTFAQYSMYCFNSNHCFGSVGLRKKNYMILNKSYSKEEYEKITQKIVKAMKENGEYGNFFSNDLSSFGYNESAAYEQFPLTKEEAIKLGFQWEDTERGTYGKETRKWNEIPEKIKDIQFEVTREIFVCTNCSKNYRIIQSEFDFYKRLEIPLPTLCPDCRHSRRFNARGPNKLWGRSCMCEKGNHGHNGTCPNRFETSYALERLEIIYCEDCYNKEVI